ncbi:HemX protein [Histophilus somni]|uniref:HemX protein n=2 Tax=Histophilus somni TaxID=731 RepID=A0AAX2S5K6_HISSO|nr:HemX protein [Histophilus somni]QEH11655.1 HemX protein [Histophilus somni]QEH25967.1 HemX protein [Histophilus somni]QEH26136.1 HemX protein [Histophilus somni]QEH50326.1 HemX protein [Histophilus somni]
MTKKHSKVSTEKQDNISVQNPPLEAELQYEEVPAEDIVKQESKAKQETFSNQEHFMERENEQVGEKRTAAQVETVVVKKGGAVIALLALLIALGIGGAGYYFGQQKVEEIQQKLTALSQPSEAVPLENNDTLLVTVEEYKQTFIQKIERLENEMTKQNQLIQSLQAQVNKLDAVGKVEQSTDWLLFETDYLLNNALRKIVLDNDVETAIALLKVADETLVKVNDPKVINIRQAINADLKQLLSVNNVDQNAIMQHLSQLANGIDELVVLNVNFDEQENTQLSDSLQDWKENVEKSAVSFLNHFIRVKPRHVNSKELLAPNQDIYLRENIRLRLQIAIMAVPRQQNDLYKQSLEIVGSWIRSYFDTSTEVAQNFLKEIDELAEKSIYVDVPNQLKSLLLLDKLLNKEQSSVQKIEMTVDKDLVSSTDQVSEEGKTDQAVEKSDEKPIEQPVEQAQ